MHDEKPASKCVYRSFGWIITFFCILFSVLTFSQTNSRTEPLARILFILDASNSMNGIWQSGRKNIIAEKLLAEALDSLQYATNVELALRVYGHQKQFPPQDCDDSKLEVPFGKYNVTRIKQKLKEITPKGTTPIAMSLELAAEDFPPCGNCRNIIILITDGIEECQGDPCAISLALQRKGIILKPFVIGIGLDVQFKETFKCVGNYYDASDEKTFKHILNIVISQALNSTTAQVNLLDINGKPTETNVNMTFYDQFSGVAKYNYVHSINHKGNPDTVQLNPIPIYKMVVHTIPPVSKEDIKLVPGKHTVIAVDAPQGYLNLRYSGTNEYKNLIAIVRKSGKMKTLHVQRFNETEKYIIGNYDLEILTLPRTYINKVNIKQSHTTKVEIPQPGIVTIITIAHGYGSIYLEDGNELKWIYNLAQNTTKEIITIQPGRYRVVFRPKSAKETIFTIEKTFKIKSGSSTAVKLN